jgi:hypothetical protein
VPENRLDELFRGPLEEFTAKRNALAKELRADGEGKAASWVKSLKKPTRAAWLVNQLGARKRKALDRLLKIGGELRGLQERMLAGSVDPEKLREAARLEQEAIDELVKAAKGIGAEHGAGAPVLERVTETLQAASSDPDVADAIDRGRLQREQRASGIGLVGATAPAPRRGAKGKGRDEAAERRASQQQARRRQAAERKLEAAERKSEKARAAAEKARAALEDRDEQLAKAEREQAAARRELDSLG